MRHIFCIVNYGTSNELKSYLDSIDLIFENSNDYTVFIADNYSTEAERLNVRNLKVLHPNLVIAEYENIGYGNALNNLNKLVISIYPNEQLRLVFSNADLKLIFYNEQRFMNGTAYLVNINGRKSLFLTQLQSATIKYFKVENLFNKIWTFRVYLVIQNILGFLPSKTFASHGSVMIFDAWSNNLQNKLIFNTRTFLYSEELEFGSWIESMNYRWSNMGWYFKHIESASIKKIYPTNSSKLPLFKLSLINWRRRWKY